MVTIDDTEPIARPSRGRRVALRVAVVGLLAVLSACGLAVEGALSAPGDDPAVAKLAEWGRDNGLGGLVTWLEGLRYAADQPAVGGTPAGGIPAAGGAEQPGRAFGGGDTPLAPLTGGRPLPGEGRWQTVVTAHGRPAVQVAALRPDRQHTSYVVGVLRMDATLVRGLLHPGTRDPGGRWRASFGLTPAEQRVVAVAFNGGFRLNDPSHNGYFSEGRTVTPLRDGAASLVLRTDGTADVGTWNGEVRMGPQVASVRQNLRMLVDGGQVNPTCATGGTKEWGSTIGQAAYIHRSGFGVRRRGVRRRTRPLRLHAGPDPRRRGGGARHGARHQPRLGLRRLLPRPPGRRPHRVRAVPGGAGAAHALPQPVEPRLVLLGPALAELLRRRAAGRREVFLERGGRPAATRSAAR